VGCKCAEGFNKDDTLVMSFKGFELFCDVDGKARVTTPEGLSDSPMVHDGRVFYDHPERFPNYIKREVARILLSRGCRID